MLQSLIDCIAIINCKSCEKNSITFRLTQLSQVLGLCYKAAMLTEDKTDKLLPY